MSLSRIPKELHAYVGERAAQDDPFLVELKQAAMTAGIPQISIGAYQSAVMATLLKLIGARDVVEVGTLGGYSAIGMARALPDGGRVRTIELDPKHADFAEAWIAKSDVANRVTVLRGAGKDVLPTIADRSADAMFLDADKQGYSAYVEHATRILRPGGLLMVDNAFAFNHLLDESVQEPDVLAIRALNDGLARHPRFEGALLPVGDGMWMARLRA
ncbi:MAG: O-methyltransferase [Planctomycetes bacterium]|nr:O-methyltransferase [Planctomycetota bacterium]MCB9903783.1 O-methyltransferase [Planctomycetota bacterium]